MRENVGDFQRLKIALLFDQELSVVVSGVVAVALETFHRLGDVESSRYHTAVAISDEARAAQSGNAFWRAHKALGYPGSLRSKNGGVIYGRGLWGLLG
jgi:hypothetical protein